MQFSTPKKMRLNNFVDVQLPKNKILFQRCQGLTIPTGSHDVPTADFTSRNIDSIAQAERVVRSGFNDYLRESQMPLDTDTETASDHSNEKPDTD